MLGWVVVLCLWARTGSAGQLEYSVFEETERSMAVANVAADLGLAVGTLIFRKFRFLSSNGGETYFGMEPGSGSLFVRDPADRERLCGAKATCILNYELVLKDPLELHKMSVRILDLNDNPPRFPEGEVRFHLAEFLPPGARFTLPNAQDADEGINGQLSYSLSPSEHFRLELGSRTDGSEYPELVLVKSLDREMCATHRLVLTAWDGGQPGRSGSVQVTVTVVDTNDNAPEFQRSVYRASVPETAPNGTVLIRVEASDPDEGTNGEVRYTFSNSTPAELRHQFRVHSHSGEVTVVAPLGPPDTLLEIFIEARDEGAFSLASTAKLLVEVTDVNDHAPEVSITSLSSPVSEDAPPGTVIALLSVRDEDRGPNARVTCTIQSSGPFQLQPSFDNYYSLLTDGPLDREQTSEYQVMIIASDGGSPPLSTRRSVTVLVEDVNDHAPSFPLPQQEFFVAENNGVGASLGRVFAQDPDLSQNGLVTYLLRSLHSDRPLASSLVEVESTSGAITAKTSFDFEQLKAFHFVVEALDGGIPARSTEVTVSVFIVDRNDNPPVILYPVIRNVSVPVETVPRQAKTGHLITKVVAKDADSGPNAWLSYHVLQASDLSLFAVSSNTGELRTLRPILPADAVKQKVVIVVQDHGDPPLSSSVTLGVLLVDSPPQVMPDFRDGRETRGQLSAPNLYLVIALACISFLFLACLAFFICIKWNQYRARGSQSCCPARYCSPESYQRRKKKPQNPGLTAATIVVTAVGRLSRTYLYQASLGFGSSNNNLMLRGEYSTADLRNLVSGVGLNLPVSCIQIGNRKGDHAHDNAMVSLCYKEMIPMFLGSLV
ncbi:LOW QUALITY PROTEIN: protocadherin alpha-C1 [Trichosurus vulpecula]|uniref:LOW QUALITY PROTEIN: protocadherin alpha-C1 n=1 Tax=Trichosurus vulpecula TaxID=9337 RepID=UPI00186B32A1|nr:LOW QUALITY PROTEIN: protocadherin alpha-C1 [Trichosurus vulpecula]